MNEALLKTMPSYKLPQNLISILSGLSKNSEYFLGCYCGVLRFLFLVEVNKENLPYSIFCLSNISLLLPSKEKKCKVDTFLMKINFLDHRESKYTS